jgi:glutamyl endopeptidase
MTLTKTEAPPSEATTVQDGQISAGPGDTGATVTAPAPAGGNLVVDPVVIAPETEPEPDEAQGHTDIGPDGSEVGVEVLEASAERLAAPVGDHTAFDDLRGIEGFDAATGAESVGLARSATQGLIPDASSALAGTQELFGFLAPLVATVGPWLASTAGPAIAGQIFDRLSSRAKRIVSRPPTGAGTVPVLVRLLNEARRRVAESGVQAVEESAVEEVVQAMEVILGTDDRVRITKTGSTPWQLICALRIEFPTGALYRGTGFLIGPRAVATAGHCVYLHNQGGWARRIEVIPGSNGAQRPYGSATTTEYRSTSGWVKDKLPTRDYGALFLPAGAFGGRQLGSFGFANFPTDVLLAKPAVLAGYPGDKAFAELWGMARRVKAVTSTQIQYDIDSAGGQSGACVYITHNGKRYVVGIHNYGASTGNTATRVTEPVAQNLLRWSKGGGIPDGAAK